MVPELESMLTKIQQLDINKVRSMITINSIMPLARLPVVTGLNGLDDWMTGWINNWEIFLKKKDPT